MFTCFVYILFDMNCTRRLDDVYIMGVNIAAMVLTMIVLSMKLKYEKATQTTSG